MIEFCLVGGGFIGPLHAGNIAAHPRAALRWVVDINLAAAEELARKFGGTPTDDLAKALADPRVAAVMICTPPRTHAAIIECAARAGKAIKMGVKLAAGKSRRPVCQVTSCCRRGMSDRRSTQRTSLRRRASEAHTV